MGIGTGFRVWLTSLIAYTHSASQGQPPLRSNASARMHQLHQLVIFQVEELLQVNATEGELAESALLLQRERCLLIITLRTRVARAACLQQQSRLPDEGGMGG